MSENSETFQRVEKMQPRRKSSVSFESQNEFVVESDDKCLHEFEDVEGYWSEDSSFSDLNVDDVEVDGDFVEEDDLFSYSIDENLVNEVHKTLNQSFSQSKVREERGDKVYRNSPLLNIDDLDVNVGSEDELGFDDNDNRSLVGSDDELDISDVFDPIVDFRKNICLKIGLQFPSVHVLRKAVRQHAVENGYEPYFLHNESARITVQCKHRCDCIWNSKTGRMPKCTCGKKNPCEYRLYATRVKEKDFVFEIRSLNLEHLCIYTTKNKMVTSEFIAERYLEVWRSDPGWALRGTQARVKMDFGVDVNYHKCWLARARAKLIIFGNSDAQYSRVWDYVHTIKQYNPGSSAFVMVSGIERPPPIFERMYICLKASKEGFVKGCRPFIGIDGCHLKGAYPGMCLAAVAMDGNNNIYPVAWAIVEVENGATWQWFLELLVRDIGMEEGVGLTFMSDRQKGLLDALKVVVPKAEIRFCVRHIWANFKKHFGGEAYKDNFWKAAWATTESEFKRALSGIRLLSDDAYNYLNGIPAIHWSRHAFSTSCKSSMILNNLCETFNAVLKDARDKPILTCMEWLRRYVMKRRSEKRDGVSNYVKRFTPYIHKCFIRLIAESRYCTVNHSIGTKFEVDYKGGSWVVNLEEKKCNCKHWELVGIPCIHAMACILHQRRNPEDFVDEAYSTQKYVLTYSSEVNPMPGVSEWEETDRVQPLPPSVRKMPGRPSKKKRRKEIDEGGQRKRVKKTVKCSRCGIIGHNIKSCKNAQSTHKPKNKGGRPSTNSAWVKEAKKKVEARNARAAHEQTILSHIGSQPSLD